MNVRPGRLAALWLMVFVVAACSKAPTTEPARSAADDTPAEHALKHANPRYRCPMHPEVVRDAPGDCPICGMALVEIEQESAAVEGARETSGTREVRISPAVINNLGVRTAPVERGSLARTAQVSGYVDFDERTQQQVRPRAEGWVDGLAVRALGETVRKGQLLFTLRSPMLESAQQEYLDAVEIGNAELIDAARGRLRALGLPSPRVPSPQPSPARAGEGAEPSPQPSPAGAGEGVRAAEGGRIPFYAPIDGVVTELEAREGAMLTPDMVAMTITALGRLWVIAEIPEAQAGWVEPGTPASVSITSRPGETLHGRVDYLYPELAMESRTLRARIVLDSPPPGLRPRMLATVDLAVTAGEETLHIPGNALIRGGSHDRVVVALGDGRFTTRRVVAGAESGDRVAIVKGLQAGEHVVTSAQFLLDSEANLDAGLERLESDAASPAAPAADPHAGHAP